MDVQFNCHCDRFEPQSDSAENNKATEFLQSTLLRFYVKKAEEKDYHLFRKVKRENKQQQRQECLDHLKKLAAFHNPSPDPLEDVLLKMKLERSSNHKLKCPWKATVHQEKKAKDCEHLAKVKTVVAESFQPEQYNTNNLVSYHFKKLERDEEDCQKNVGVQTWPDGRLTDSLRSKEKNTFSLHGEGRSSSGTCHCAERAVPSCEPKQSTSRNEINQPKLIVEFEQTPCPKLSGVPRRKCTCPNKKSCYKRPGSPESRSMEPLYQKQQVNPGGQANNARCFCRQSYYTPNERKNSSRLSANEINGTSYQSVSRENRKPEHFSQVERSDDFKEDENPRKSSSSIKIRVTEHDNANKRKLRQKLRSRLTTRERMPNESKESKRKEPKMTTKEDESVNPFDYDESKHEEYVASNSITPLDYIEETSLNSSEFQLKD